MTVAADQDRAGGTRDEFFRLTSPQPLRLGSSLSPNAISYVMNCVVIVELFTSERLLSIYDLYASQSAHPIFDDMWQIKRKGLDSSWPNMIAAFKVWPNIDLKTFDTWSAMAGYIEARNSWAHGQGRLTSRQVRDQAVPKRIQAADFALEDDVVIVRGDQILDVARNCRLFVATLDQLTLQHGVTRS